MLAERLAFCLESVLFLKVLKSNYMWVRVPG